MVYAKFPLVIHLQDWKTIFQDIYKQVLKITKKFGKKTAIHCSGPDTGRFFLKMGFDMVTISTDLNLLKKIIDVELKKMK